MGERMVLFGPIQSRLQKAGTWMEMICADVPCSLWFGVGGRVCSNTLLYRFGPLSL